MKQPFKQAAGIIDTLNTNGHEAFFVGGSVRDSLLNRPVGDVDIATSATPQEAQGLFHKVIPVGIKHGTVIVRHGGESYEVTTFRVEGHYSDQRHPDSVVFVNSIEEDLRRRDFTINALALDRRGNVIDPFDGKQDIKKQLIRSVGNGCDRFEEDALRIIRGIRFAAELGFDIESKTLSNMKLMQTGIKHLAVERIQTEMEKLIMGPFIQKGLQYLSETGVFKHLPIFKEHHALFEITEELTTPLMEFAELIAFGHYKQPNIPIAKWVSEWKASNEIKRKATTLVKALFYFDRHGLDHWLAYILPLDQLQSFANLSGLLHEKPIHWMQLNSMNQTLQINSRSELAINGHDLMQLFSDTKPGPWLKSTLQTLEKQVVMNQISNDKHELKEWVKCHPPDVQ